MEKTQYIGQQKVREYNEVEGKVSYLLESNSGATVTKVQFDSMLSEEPYDDGLVRVKKWNPAIRDIMRILLSNDMTLLEKDFVTGRIDETILQNYQIAAAKAFGADYEHNISLTMIDKILADAKKSAPEPAV